MNPKTSTPEHTRTLPGIILAALLAVFSGGCDTADRTGSGPPDGEKPEPGTAQQAVQVDTGDDMAAASMPAAVSTTTAADASRLPAGTFDLRLNAGRFTILANDAPPRDILNNLAILAGFEIVDTGDPLKQVTLAIEDSDIHAALVALLKPGPYQVIYEFDNTRSKDTLTRIVIGRTSAVPKMAQTQSPPPAMEGAPLPGAGEAPLSVEDQAYLTLLLDPSPKVRADAAESIEATGIALDYLARIITTDPSPEVRMAATYSLENSEDPRAVETLIMGLDDADPEVLVEVIDSLDFLDDRSAIPYLQPLLDHPDEEVRDAAESAIESLR